MPPSVDSACTQSPCVTRSTPKKRNTCFSKLYTNDQHKKSMRTSSLSETASRRYDNLDMMGQLTQESQKNQSSPNADAHVNVELPPKCQPQKNDGFLKRALVGKEEGRAGEDLDLSIRSMILHLNNLAQSILVAYEKERDHANSPSSEIIMELAQLRTFNEAATKELAQLRIFIEAVAADNAKLMSENASLAEKEAATFSKLNELRKQCSTRDTFNIGAAFVMSKALFLREKAEIDATLSSEINQLRFDNTKLIREAREIEEKGREQILHLQSLLADSVEQLTKLRSEKEMLMNEKNEMEATRNSATEDLLSRLAAANEEVKQVRTETEALLRNKDETAARTAGAAALELDNIKARNETIISEMQTAMERKKSEIEEMRAVIESTTANVRKVFLEKEDIARQKAESEALAKMDIAQLRSEKAELLVEKEKTSATVEGEFKKLRSLYDAAVEKLKAVQQVTDLEKAKLKSVIVAKNSELLKFKKLLVEGKAALAARDAQGAAEIHRLSREKEQSHAREAILLEKLQSSRVSRSHLEMHVAFLSNCGLIRPEDYNVSFMSH